MVQAASTRETLYSVHSVSKRYGGVQALAGVDFAVRPGEVHAVVGENGAGKSTLMKIFAGAELADSGEVRIGDRSLRFRSAGDGARAGIAIVFQELSLFPDIDVLANLFVQSGPTQLGILDRRAMRRRAREVMTEVGLDVPLHVPVASLRLGERQLLEICRALLTDARVVILDEPNSALNATETDRLFEVIRKLRADGVAVIYVSHRLEEVLKIADVVTVMRNGSIVRTLPAVEATIGGLVADMLGDLKPAVQATSARHRSTSGEPLRIDNVAVHGLLQPLSLEVWPGEIVGLAGLEGSGVRTLLDILFGVSRYEGSVTLPNGRPGPSSMADSVRAGIAYIPPDRKRFGASLQQSVLENLVVVTAGVLGRYGFLLSHSSLRRDSIKQIQSLRIGTPGVETVVGRLSGGNQQKVVLGKWLAAEPSIVILDDPTRGVDVGAKQEFYRIIRGLADDGRIVLFTSSELPEFGLLCDSVAVFYKGRHVGTYPSGKIYVHRLLEAINTGRLQ